MVDQEVHHCLRHTEVERGVERERKQTEQMVENKDVRLPGDCVVPQMVGLEFDPPGGHACRSIELLKCKL